MEQVSCGLSNWTRWRSPPRATRAARDKEHTWETSPSSAPSGATKARARSSTGWPSRADVVVRFQGGHNAGHTLVVGDQTYKLSLLPVGHRARHAVGHRQRRGARPVGARRPRSSKLAAQGVDDHARRADDRRQLPADPAASTATSTRCARTRRGAGKIGTTGRGIGPAYEDKVGRRAIRVCDLADLDDLEPQLDRLLRAPRRAARRLRRAAGRPRAAARATSREIAEFVLPFARPVWRDLDEALHARASASCSRARRARCSTSTTAPIRSSPRPTPSPARRGSGSGHRPAARRLRARHRQGLHHARRLGPVPDRAGRRDRPAARRARPRVRHRHRPPAPLRLVRRGAGAPGGRGQRHHRHRADQARRARRVRDAEDLHRLPARRRDARLSARRTPPTRRGSSRSTRRSRAGAGSTARRAQLGRPAGAGDQIRPPHRGADRLPGGAGLDHRPSATTRSWCATRSRVRAGPRSRSKSNRLDVPRRATSSTCAEGGPRRSRSISCSTAVSLAFDMRLDRAVGAVAHPAGDAELAAWSRSQARKNTPWTRPVTRDVPRDLGHHTVAMSGASSAFMPTTL